MTNRTTEQDMEAESVDKADTTLNKSPDINEEAVTEVTEPDTPSDATEGAAEKIEETAPEPTEEIFDESVIVPGSLSRALKKCREQADISIEDAAGEMRLPLAVVKALEEENFADLPDPPYVRGYLRSYARLNESDSTNLITYYETLRGADPKDVASFTPTTPRYQPNNKKAVSSTTIKLAGFSMVIMLLVVLSMIPAVSQWASDTWQSFSEPQNQRLAAASSQNTADGTDADATDNAETDTNQTTQNSDAASSSSSSSSSSDTATADNSEQLAPNQDATDTATQDKDNAAEQDKSNEQTTDATATETPTSDQEKAADETDATKTASEGSETGTDQAAADKAEPTDTAAATDNASQTETDTDKADSTETVATNGEADPTKMDAANGETDTAAAAATETTQTEQETAAAIAEAAKQEQVNAEKAADEKAEADKLAAQQAEAAKQEDKFQQPIDGNVLIRLVFTQDVWMSIKDGKGKTIFGALNAAGTRKEIKAKTPLQFKVGNAPGVQIYLNGQLIDQKPYTRGSVSTFRAN